MAQVIRGRAHDETVTCRARELAANVQCCARMRPIVLSLVWIVAVAASSASAQPAQFAIEQSPASALPPPIEPAAGRASSPPSREADAPRFALAVSVPALWIWSFAASGWVAIDRHNAVRVNVARYLSPAWEVLPAYLYSEGYSGGITRFTDVSAGWVYYPRRLLSGLTLEAGALLRFREPDSDLRPRTQAFAGRGLIGWTWRLDDASFFVTASVGASLGYERGPPPDYVPPMNQASRTARLDASLEWYLRWGFAFGV